MDAFRPARALIGAATHLFECANDYRLSTGLFPLAICARHTKARSECVLRAACPNGGAR
jgi:hypothetical protein